MNMKRLIKLQVFLSHNDECSRRTAMDLIKQGMVTVNNKVELEPSTQINPEADKVCLDGKRIKEKSFVYLMLYKPSGYVTTKSDPNAEKTIYDLLPKKYNFLSPVGRLDKDTEGLLLLTNNGDVANKLTHPKFNVDKVYFVRIRNRLELVDRLKVEKGVYIDGKKTTKAKIKILKLKRDFTDCQITVHEGRKRQVRRMFAKVKHKVIFLKRISQGPLVLSSLKAGTFRPLNQNEIDKLLNL